ncbi:ATP-binding cassette domain-containing protein [Inhella sp.]|uniref:ATP-binding cassette domain-containing protein n=1 Tax=Inhella sp. TaxID=1921806 RepID=UPI0035AFB381
MALLSLTNAHLAFGHWPLLDAAEFSLETGERVGLIGRNGSGKSSLLKILAGLEKLDDGLLQRSLETRVVYVPQEPEFAPGATVFEAVSEGVAEARDLRARFEAHEGEDLDALQTRIEALGGWTWEQRVTESLQRLGLDGARRVEELSGGLKKRVALARALVAQPDVLLLDEPTNHLDLDAILWLEGLLREFPGSLLVITHDRAFLDAVCTRIVELDRGQLRGYPGNFAAFEAAKQRELEAEALANARFDKLLAQEEVWIRKGVEARRTRSVARVARLVKLREEHAQRRNVQGKAQLKVDAGESSGKLVAELVDVTKGFAGAPPVVKNLSAVFMRGDKVGLVGPNGAGKTTLLKLILGELQPDSGSVRTGTKIQVAHFDQMRAGLNLDATLADTISPGSEWIEIGEQRQHVMTYLQNFLFAPQRANSPVRTLSGGERNRLLLARLFARPANVLVLDEPTNDLDVETLDLLEELLIEYAGTVFLVSHDRRFLDRVVTSTLVAEGQGVWREYEGGVEDWLAQSQRARAAAQAAAAPKAEAAKTAPAPRSDGPALKRKLSYKEQRELEALPAQIEALEKEQAELNALMNGSELYTQGAERISQVTARAAAIDEELMALLERWTALSD